MERKRKGERGKEKEMSGRRGGRKGVKRREG